VALDVSVFAPDSGDELLHLLIPQTPLYPVSRLYVPVFLEQPREGGPVGVVAVKCRARQGVRILGVEETSRNWTLRYKLSFLVDKTTLMGV
jgi:hypothetical protein